MQTVAELHSFRKSATAAGITEDEIVALVLHLAANPDAGVEIADTGGCRKVRIRIGRNNKGKSGGARVITFFSGVSMPVYLLAAFAKSEKVNLTKAERKQLRSVTEQIVVAYENRVTLMNAKAGATG